MAGHIIAGDIGGTHARLIYAEVRGGNRVIVTEHEYLCSQYKDFYHILDAFTLDHIMQAPIDAACIAIAGPVESGVAHVTNLPWVISEQQLSERLKTPRVILINDFVAAAHGVSDLNEEDMILLQQGSKPMHENEECLKKDAVIVGAGTGFGAAHLVWMNGDYEVFSSEAGHAGFSPENALQCDLLSWMQKKNEYVSLEMLLSGQGLIRIYTFLHEITDLIESPDILEAMKTGDPAQVIAEQALLDNDDLCVKALDVFIDIYGAAASNVALHYYPVHELYIAGGIAPKIKDKMVEKQGFINAFVNKGKMSSNMKKLSIKLILQDKVGLYGALSVAHTQSIRSM